MEALTQKNTLQNLPIEVKNEIFFKLTIQELLLRFSELNTQFHLDAKQALTLWSKLIVIHKISGSAIAALKEVKLLNLQVNHTFRIDSGIVFPNDDIYTLENITFLSLRGLYFDEKETAKLAKSIKKQTKLDLSYSYINEYYLSSLKTERPDLEIMAEPLAIRSIEWKISVDFLVERVNALNHDDMLAFKNRLISDNANRERIALVDANGCSK